MSDTEWPADGEGAFESSEKTATVTERPRPIPREVPASGTTLAGRYTVLEPLGEGGMSIVLAAYDAQLDRRVALKLLRARTEPDDDARSELRMVREAQAMARLNHPNVVAVYDSGRLEDGSFFIAMEYVEGQTLRQWRQERPRPWREVLDSFLAAGRGLAAAHEAGLIHRDFKPDNVLVGRDGRVRVTDFGVARTRLRGGQVRRGHHVRRGAAAPGGRASLSPAASAGPVPARPEPGGRRGIQARRGPRARGHPPGRRGPG